MIIIPKTDCKPSGFGTALLQNPVPSLLLLASNLLFTALRWPSELGKAKVEHKYNEERCLMARQNSGMGTSHLSETLALPLIWPVLREAGMSGACWNPELMCGFFNTGLWRWDPRATIGAWAGTCEVQLTKDTAFWPWQEKVSPLGLYLRPGQFCWYTAKAVIAHPHFPSVLKQVRVQATFGNSFIESSILRPLVQHW